MTNLGVGHACPSALLYVPDSREKGGTRSQTRLQRPRPAEICKQHMNRAACKTFLPCDRHATKFALKEDII